MSNPRERPILMKDWGVRATIQGRKTQTRRIMNPQPARSTTKVAPWVVDGYGRQYRGDRPLWCADHGNGLGQEYACPCGQPGDLLWVRETWSHDGPSLDHVRRDVQDALGSGMYGPYYKATEIAPETLRWRPSIHMPKWAARIWLRVTGVSVERVQEICASDADAEGIPDTYGHAVMADWPGIADIEAHVWDNTRRVDRFREVWDDINANPRPRKRDGEIAFYDSYPWEEGYREEQHRGKPHYIHGNPWVRVVEYEVASTSGRPE